MFDILGFLTLLRLTEPRSERFAPPAPEFHVTLISRPSA